MIEPYYQDNSVTIYNGDCAEIVPQLGKFDLLLTDPPYGINCDKGMKKGGYSASKNNQKRKKRNPRIYDGGWDKFPPDKKLLDICIKPCNLHIIWGGNYFSETLRQMPKWLVWDKQQPMPTYSDAELAWTTLPGVSVKMFKYCGAGIMAKEKDRKHPTQKPIALITWCISLAGDIQTILDPFAGSGTTGRAAKDMGKTAVLIEKEERYCEIAAKRMAQEVFEFS